VGLGIGHAEGSRVYGRDVARHRQLQRSIANAEKAAEDEVVLQESREP
jgi:hypothetical protein